MRDAICKECCPYGCDAHFEEAVKDSERLKYVIDRRDFLWDCWDMTEAEGRDAIDEAMEAEI